MKARETHSIRWAHASGNWVCRRCRMTGPQLSMKPCPSPERYAALGKEILRDGLHFADVIEPGEAARIAELLNERDYS